MFTNSRLENPLKSTLRHLGATQNPSFRPKTACKDSGQGCYSKTTTAMHAIRSHSHIISHSRLISYIKSRVKNTTKAAVYADITPFTNRSHAEQITIPVRVEVSRSRDENRNSYAQTLFWRVLTKRDDTQSPGYCEYPPGGS